MAMLNISSLTKMKQDKQKITCITAYDASFASIFDEVGIQIMLIGDSLGMVLQGYTNTIPVTLNDIKYHTKCVARATKNAFILADLPFMTYSTSHKAYDSAAELIRAGANMVKLEGGEWLSETIKGLVERGIPVCAHLGLTPQSINVLGGFKVQGRKEVQAEKILQDALLLEECGAQLLVIECVPLSLAKRITDALRIPVIGIGASNVTDGQVLVMHDAFGISSGFCPKFTKNFLLEAKDIKVATALYKKQVEDGSFPAQEHFFN